MPLPLIGALLMNAAMLLVWLIGIMEFRHEMSPFGLGMVAVSLALNIVGVVSIIARQPVARRFNAWFLGMWTAFVCFPNIPRVLRGDLPRLLTLVVLLGISVPIVWGLLRNPRVPVWLASRRSAVGVGTREADSGGTPVVGPEETVPPGND